jgi:hypothetical protein
VHGHLAVAKWLTSTFNLTNKNNNNKKRLTSTFNLTANDARNVSALLWSGWIGHLGMAQWLVATFNLTADDARARDSDALGQSLASGRTAVVEWLTSTFGGVSVTIV